jgi:adenosylcobinamide-GDP ribazoletransferase
MLSSLTGALQFLTILPVPGDGDSPARSAVFFPLIGWALGAAGGLLFVGLQSAWPAPVAALAAVAFWSIVTGTLHEDGLADVADAFRAGRSPERIHAILKDSRIGSYGATAIALSLVARWLGVSTLSGPVVLRLAAVLALSRTVMVALAWVSRPAGTGLGAVFARSMSTPAALIAIAQGVAAALLCGPRLGVVLLAVNTLLVLAARQYFHRRIGGVTGDCLGAACQLSEIASLFFLSCQTCLW